ncbi:MAG TPA: 30S ribosome-binding factor RbfA [Chloroflexia bacterium]|nr:30S ribosome-binding factor RbfA [Chloroflexia bacterium]
MPTRRQIQVSDEIQQIVSVLMQREMKDPRIGFTTVTQVEVTSDFKYARIYVSVMGTPQEQKETMAAFTSARGWFRRELAHRMTMRTVPEIQFKLDTSIEYSDNINRLLNELKEAEIQKEAATPEGDSGEQP